MHALLTFCWFTFSVTLGSPVYVNNAYQSEGHVDDNTISIQGGSGGEYVLGDQAEFDHSHEEHQQVPVVQKHIYVHIPPPEEEYSVPQRVVPPPPPKIHYKIVFIKAPSPVTQAAPVLPAPQQDQEKTLIYVLHKQPVDTPPIVIPTPKPTAPAKPEVYFIRYKTQKELVSAQGSYEHSSTAGPYISGKKLRRGYRGSTAVSIIPHPSSTHSPKNDFN